MRTITTLLALSALALAALEPTPALACGGTFCDQPAPNQPPMPVEQTGENVLFVVTEGFVEAHVQIQYTGNPERFAWVVPVPRKPEIRVGSQQLFTNLLGSTVPTFQAQQTFASCGSGSSSDREVVGCGSSDSDSAASEFAPSSGRNESAGGGASGGTDTVLARASVGAYETTTLGGGTAEELIGWLKDNKFEVPASTNDLIASYLEQEFVFVAVKLTAGAETSEIHPLVFRYEGTQPCVPLKLTAVAAVENMGVRTFFLGDKRYAPLNYKHVVPNDLIFNWATVATNAQTPGGPQGSLGYEALIARVVDSDVAMGRAFVTEYAGPSNVVPTTGLTNAAWRSAPYVDAGTPGQAVQLLKSQGLLDCSTGTCRGNHPLVLPLLHQFIPLPGQATDGYYGNCGSCQQGEKPWNAQVFAAELDERILAPGRRAEQALSTRGYLTRMFTAISPAEMTTDPEFVAALDATPLSQARTVTRQRQCDGLQLTVVGPREVAPAPSATTWPTLPTMPTAERIEEYNVDGSVTVLRDNGPAIDEQLAQYNATLGWPPVPEFVVEDESNTCALDPGPVRGSTTARLALGLVAASLVARRWRRRSA